MSVYSVNGNTPYFASAKEARAHALASGGTLVPIGGLGNASMLAMIFRDDEMIGRILYPPYDGGVDRSVAYWCPDGVNLYPLNADGSYDSKDVTKICFDPQAYLCINEEKELPFESLEHALRWFAKNHPKDGSVGARIVSKDRDLLGTVYNLRDGTIIFVHPNGTDGDEITPSGRIGKRIDVGQHIAQMFYQEYGGTLPSLAFVDRGRGDAE